MKNSQFIFFLALSFLFKGCFIADEFFLENEDDSISLQQRSQIAVSNYLIETFGEQYKPYGFSDVVVFKPAIISERDSLTERYKLEPTIELEKKINDLNDSIRIKTIKRTAEISHFYCVESDSNGFEIMEATFKLSDTLSVINFDPTIYLPAENEMKNILYNFFYEKAIFITPSYNQSQQMSKNFYAFYKSRLESFDLMIEKSKFLEHSLIITALVKLAGDYNPTEIAKVMTLGELKNEFGENVMVHDWSELNEVNSEERGLEGYYFFTKFTINPGEDTLAKVFEFNPYFEFMHSEILPPPYSSYFK